MSVREALEKQFKEIFIDARKLFADKGPIHSRCRIVGNTLVYHSTFKRTLAEHLRNRFLYERGLLNLLFAEVLSPLVIEQSCKKFDAIYPGLCIERITVAKMDVDDPTGETIYVVVLNMDVEKLMEQGKAKVKLT